MSDLEKRLEHALRSGVLNQDRVQQIATKRGK